MPGRAPKTMNETYRIRQFSSFADLPAPHRTLLGGEIERQGLFREPAWFEHLMRNFFDEGHELRLYAVEDSASDQPLLLAPLRYTTHDNAIRRGHVIGAISNPENYTTTALMFAPRVEQPVRILTALFKHFRLVALEGRGYDGVRLWPVELDSPLGVAIDRALRDAGFVIQTYANSYNRFEDTAGLSYGAYFAQRSANMRYNVRRRQRALERRGDMEFVLVTGSAGLEAAIADYIQVSRHSWKELPSMFAPETLQLMSLSASKGCLRLGILRLGDEPVAVQFWIVSGGTAHCARLAYHEAYKKLGVGVVLTSRMIAHVLDHDHVRRLDYGYGHDEYKRGWMKSARDYHGFMAFNPATPLGRIYAFRHIQGRWGKRLLKRGLGWLGWARFKETPTADGG